MGRRAASQSVYKDLRLRRRNSSRFNAYPEYITVQQKSTTGWISLGDFDSEDQAVDFLVERAELIAAIEADRELAEMDSYREQGGFDEQQ